MAKPGRLGALAAVAGILAGLAGAVAAQEVVEGARKPAPPPVARACRTFPLNVEDGQGGYFETSDRTGPVGEWLGPLEDAGWRVTEVDFELGQRKTGFPMAQVMICAGR